MNDYKGILQSRAVWAAIVAFIAFALQTFNADKALDSAAQQALVEAILQIVQAGGIVLAAIFRIFAKSKIA